LNVHVIIKELIERNYDDPLGHLLT